MSAARGPSSNGSDLSKRKFRLVYRSEDIEGSLPALIPTSKHAHHLKQGLAGRCSRVEPLLMPEQVDTQCMQLGQEPNPPLAVPE